MFTTECPTHIVSTVEFFWLVVPDCGKNFNLLLKPKNNPPGLKVLQVNVLDILFVAFIVSSKMK